MRFQHTFCGGDARLTIVSTSIILVIPTASVLIPLSLTALISSCSNNGFWWKLIFIRNDDDCVWNIRAIIARMKYLCSHTFEATHLFGLQSSFQRCIARESSSCIYKSRTGKPSILSEKSYFLKLWPSGAVGRH